MQHAPYFLYTDSSAFPELKSARCQEQQRIPTSRRGECRRTPSTLQREKPRRKQPARLPSSVPFPNCVLRSGGNYRQKKRNRTRKKLRRIRSVTTGRCKRTPLKARAGGRGGKRRTRMLQREPCKQCSIVCLILIVYCVCSNTTTQQLPFHSPLPFAAQDLCTFVVLRDQALRQKTLNTL